MSDAASRTALALPSRQALSRLAVGGAWFFIVFSLAHLAWVVGVKTGGTSGLATLYQTTVLTPLGPEIHRAWGLAYHGFGGLLLALVQAGVVLAAAVMSTRPGRRARRIGHGVLIAWAGLWAIDLVGLARLDHQFDSFGQAALMSVLFGCTLYRAVVSPRDRPKATNEPDHRSIDDMTPDDELRPEHIVASGAVREITPAALRSTVVPADPAAPRGRVRTLRGRVETMWTRVGVPTVAWVVQACRVTWAWLRERAWPAMQRAWCRLRERGSRVLRALRNSHPADGPGASRPASAP